MSREVDWTDEDGRRWRRLIPDEAPDEHAEFGVPIGPISLADLNLPIEFEVRLHNAMHDRSIWTYDEARRRASDIAQAVFHTAKADALRIVELYRKRDILGAEDGPERES